MTPKVKFNWSTLDRNTIANFVLEIAPKLTKQPIDVDIFHAKLTRHIKNLVPVRFKKNRNFKVEPNQIWVGGAYYSDKDEDRQKCIELVLEYPLFYDQVKISKQKFVKIAYSIADTLLHELIHMRQFRRRNFKVLPDYESTASRVNIRIEQSYLGCSDEIDAYSFNIACELIDKFKGNETDIVNYLNENQKGIRRKSNSWRMYLKAFQHDHNHPIIQRVKKKVVRYLPQAQLGKPYRNKDWIDR